MTEIVIPLVVITVLILLNGLFVAAEFSIVAVPQTRIAHLAEEGSGPARHVLSILRDLDRQNQYIATAQVGITIVSLGLGMYGEHVVADWFLHYLEGLGRLAEPAAHTLATVLAVGLLTYLHVVIGEMIPKSLALQAAETTVLNLDRPMLWIGLLFRPLVIVLNEIGNGIVRLMGIPPFDVSARLYSPEELEIIVDESREGGLLASKEQLFIQNIFDLQQRSIGQIMTPRPRIVGVALHEGAKAVMSRLCETRQTRYPVFDTDLDHIIGTLHIKDIARLRAGGQTGVDLQEVVRPAVFLPESLSVERALSRFRLEKLQMAIVIDEYGGTAGLITLEDLVEEVVGEIRDEFDQEIEPMAVLSDGQVRVRGDLILDELAQHYGMSLDFPGVDTVGGLVMTVLGRIPKPGDVVEVDGAAFEVESVVGLAVQTVLVRLSQ